ncbi:MAG TPA: IPT/TIG domain-containing protein, partial [Candidatus Acidoferrum sp.]|nr:IPT/TIG domain-containing protein [Candidatus Acidoferrum sp.]
PSTVQFTTQMEWRADQVTFRAWNGWSSAPAPSDIIYQWTRTGTVLPTPGNERVHINLWLLNGTAPTRGIGDTMIINSFTFQSGPPSITSVAPVYSTVSTIQPGEWVSIFGTNLAGSTMNWNGDFPTSLGGTSVTINGKAAYLSFVSPTQVNLQTPDDATVGPAPVVVTTTGGAATSTVTLAKFAPSLLLLDSKHVAGIIPRSDGSGAYGNGRYDIIGPTGNSLGYPTVAAKAGDNIMLFGVGFGPTDPAVPAGQPFSGAAPATNPVNLLINNVPVTSSFAGLSGPGLFQFNLTVPAGLGPGDVSLGAAVGGVQTPSGVVISLQ